MMIRKQDSARNAGMTLVEVMVSASIMTVVMTAMVVGVQQEASGLSDMVDSGTRERLTQELLQKIESRLEFAAGATPIATLTESWGGIATPLTVDSSLGFPPIGYLVLDPGSINEERVIYRGLDVEDHEFTIQKHGVQCTTPSGHGQGSPVVWSGSAHAIENQTNPLANQYEGIAASPVGNVFFRGDGTGFSYRLPTDPAGGTDYFDANGVRWGATVSGSPSLDGWAAIYWQPVKKVTELELGRDVNQDGDREDTFQLGRLKQASWDAFSNGTDPTIVGLSPPIVLQEDCNHGGDLNFDGFDDPMFLWNPHDASLTLRMTVLTGTAHGRTSLQRVETTIFLRNGEID